MNNVDFYRITPQNGENIYMSRRSQIINVAVCLFKRFGYEKVTIDNINEECGIARGTFYLYFKNKEDLLNQILKKTFSEMLDEIVRRLDRNGIMPNFDEDICFIAEIMFSFFEDKINLLKLIILSREFSIPAIDSSRDLFFDFFVERYEPYLLSIGLVESEIITYITVKMIALNSVTAYCLVKCPENTDIYLKMIKLVLS
ncbi:TetR/AcrR family transcriptional regulator [Paenibacillus frigoriresistens]|uniref:TetR/AcrR family transcriptional regulator n=1 Tax=Paenibacillus alginolyticus TaxID=59839 RepID=UPI0015655B29|nr:TetR/AcrR family transcriptional regulator [Paenibacillus frigoriresistens]NRF96064.1 TetR/AcrR family transcriptional regulator [Paenibacillus frigoriresistens]